MMVLVGFSMGEGGEVDCLPFWHLQYTNFMNVKQGVIKTVSVHTRLIRSLLNKPLPQPELSEWLRQGKECFAAIVEFAL